MNVEDYQHVDKTGNIDLEKKPSQEDDKISAAPSSSNTSKFVKLDSEEVDRLINAKIKDKHDGFGQQSTTSRTQLCNIFWYLNQRYLVNKLFIEVYLQSLHLLFGC